MIWSGLGTQGREWAWGVHGCGVWGAYQKGIIIMADYDLGLSGLLVWKFTFHVTSMPRLLLHLLERYLFIADFQKAIGRRDRRKRLGDLSIHRVHDSFHTFSIYTVMSFHYQTLSRVPEFRDNLHRCLTCFEFSLAQ